LQDCGIAALAIHGRTRAQGYSGEADWRVIGEVAESIALPVIGNGDLFSAEDVARRRAETKIAGAMVGRAAMSAPWIFQQIKGYLDTGEILPSPALPKRWEIIIEHCRAEAELWGVEEPAMRAMRSRLMAYSRNLPEAKSLREKLQHVSSIDDVERVSRDHLERNAERALAGIPS
jgi:tRNA-dihydrouridine synthase